MDDATDREQADEQADERADGRSGERERGGPGTRPPGEDLPGKVDEMERDIEEERRRRGVPGNADERRRTGPTVPDDQAPD